MVRVGISSFLVAALGVIGSFTMGWGAAALFLPGSSPAVHAFLGATITATSVGITARVLSDLGRLKTAEGQVILGAAILDDVIGLVILSVVAGMTGGESVSFAMIARTTCVAFGFLAITVVVGRFVVTPLTHYSRKIDLPGTPTILALMLAFGLGWLADRVGSAPILGAFAAGLLVVGTPRFHDIEVGVTRLGHFFVPLFFVTVGAAVDVTVLNPIDPVNHRTLLIALMLSIVAVAGKFLSGYAPFWFKGKKSLIGAGMIPRGEVGLIFAAMGKGVGILDEGMFAAVTVVVMVTTFLAPPLLKYLAPPLAGAMPERDHEGIEDLATEG